MEQENALSKIVIGKCLEIQKQLGSGLLESVYREVLFYELEKEGLLVKKEVVLPLVYKEIKLDQGYRLDLLVENKLVIELKVVEELHKNHKAQLLSYLRLGGFRLGLLVNFMESYLKDGIKRVIN